MNQKRMRSDEMNSLARITRLALPVLVAAFAFATLSTADAAQGQKAPEASKPAQKTFNTPKAAADAIIQAAADFDVDALKAILGPDGEDLVVTGDRVQDKNRATAFAAKAREKESIVMDPQDHSRATLVVGNDDWPFAIPIVEESGVWSFDTDAGREEVLMRRIGSNELDAIQVCMGYVEAQQEYALEKHDGAEANQYAQRVISTPGKHDGLVWRNADGSLGGPVGEEIGKALEQGYGDKSQPYHGYFFKILKGQGPDAPLGQMDFVVHGAMIGGFALAAAPAEYRVTGVKTFIVSYEGVVYEKDLGPDTIKTFKDMELYNPDKSWHPVSDRWVKDATDTGAQ